MKTYPSPLLPPIIAEEQERSLKEVKRRSDSEPSVADATLASPIRVGIAGLGRAGVQLHIEPMRARSHYKIVGVCDQEESRRLQEATRLGAKPYATLQEMIQARECDLIVIATPSHHHFSDAMAVLRAGIHCVLEKPMATVGAEARQLVEAAREMEVKLFVHHQFVYDAEVKFLKEAIASQKIGKVFHIDIFWTSYVRRWDWQTLRKNGGGVLLNTCPHLLTLLLALLGGDLQVESALVRLVKDFGDTEDDVRLVVRGVNGITATATVSSVNALAMPRLTLYGSSGTLQEDYRTARLRFFNPEEAPERLVIDQAAPTDGCLIEELPWKEQSIALETDQGGYGFHDNIADTLLKGIPFQAPPEQAVRIIELLEEIAEIGAAQKRLPVEIERA